MRCEPGLETIEVFRDDDPAVVSLASNVRDDLVVSAAVRTEMIENQQFRLRSGCEFPQRYVTRVKFAEVLGAIVVSGRIGSELLRLRMHFVNQDIDARCCLLD